MITKHRAQNIGSILIVIAYVLLLLNLPYVAWLGCLLTVGLLELYLIYFHDATITKYVRSLAPKKIDTVLMLGIIPLTWWLAGPLAAGFLFIGLLVNHFGERQE